MTTFKVQFFTSGWRFLLPLLLSLSTLLFVQHTLAQPLADRSLPIIHMQEEVFFCPSVSNEISPDSITDGTAPYHFTWTSNGSIVSSDSILLVSLSDTSQFELQIVDSDGKIARDTLLLIPHQAIDAGFQINRWEGCAPVEIIFTSDYLSFQHVSDMSWDFGDGNSNHQMASMVYTYENEGFYNPRLRITDHYGCIWSDTSEIGIRVFPTPHASFQVKEQRLYLPETTLEIENTSTGADQFIWHYASNQAIYEFEPRIEFPQHIESRYELELTAINAFGCIDKTSNMIDVVQAIELYLPNAFTPNGDGINDFWQIEGLGVDAFHIQIEIYDVWGTIVFASDSPNAIWDAGAYTKGVRVPSGQYNYRVLARDTERGIGHLFEGHIQVLY
jgi:gliding motility-associated-like protein